MSTLSIPPVSSVSSGVDLAADSPGLQQTAFRNLLSRLQQAISAGNLSSSRSLLNALDALPPRGVSEVAALSKFLSDMGAALANGSKEAAKRALSAFQEESQGESEGSQSSFGSTAGACTIANNFTQRQLQLNLASALLLPPGSIAPPGAAATDSVSCLIAFLNTTFGNGDATSAASANQAQSPYDTLVSVLTTNLAAGIGTAGPALAYLQSRGSLVSMEA